MWPFSKTRALRDIVRTQREELDRLRWELSIERAAPRFEQIAEPILPHVAEEMKRQAYDLVAEQLADILRPHVTETLRRAFRGSADTRGRKPMLVAAIDPKAMVVHAEIALPSIHYQFRFMVDPQRR